ncbi:Pentatricopeptide repeat-containing protein [Thalictrum thalictroides]|uniref:Pentatricopeptide repeat-containing protein n=1 Tax=Thalictrum thalictroides TaxID=46969 RepID=A0A7J6VJM8_THATH|nr:Pentatricopeptide repeat-containing protein [Thalictrum thalictroides]
MYADCNDLVFALHLFDKLPQPNVFAWTAILGYYSRNGMYKDCLETYSEMRVQGVRPDRYVFPKVLKACAQSLSLKKGICIHRDIVRFGAESNHQVCNSLIDMYSKCRDVRTARRVFDEMGERDLLSWNTLISGYVSNGFVELAIKLIQSMRLDGVEPDLVSWNTVMDAYCRMGQCEEASRTFEHIEEPNVISWTTLISGYSRIGKHDIALGIFRNMMSSRGAVPDSDALSNILVCCRLVGAYLNGREIHGFGIKTQTLRDFYNSAGAALLTMYARCRRAQCAANVFELMDKSDVVTWNAMILAFVHLGMGDLALTCFSQVQTRGIKNDEVTISALLPACDLKFGKQIHAYIRRNDFDSAITIWNALINMYSKNGCVEDAYHVFKNMGMKDIVSWNTMIGGYGMHGNGVAALQLLRDMCHAGIQPNSVTFTSALSACSHSGLVDEGLQLFCSLSQEFGITLTMEQFACVVDLLARAGQLEDAVQFINSMPIKPDKSIWGAVLAACQAHQNINIGKLAAEHLFCLEPENPGNYVTLSNIYAKAGSWSDEVAVRKLMESRGLIKPSGYSWVDSEN